MDTPDNNPHLEPSKVAADRRWSAPWLHSKSDPNSKTASAPEPQWLSGLVKDEEPAEPLPGQPAAPSENEVPHPEEHREDHGSEAGGTQEVSVAHLLVQHRRHSPKSHPKVAPERQKHASVGHRDRSVLYRSLSVMFDAGVPLYAIFDFLGQEGENPRICEACSRISQRLRTGHTLTNSLGEEPQLFHLGTIKMIEAGSRGGQLHLVLDQLAAVEEKAWKLRNQLLSQLTYPFLIAGLTLLAVILLPPLVLTQLLKQIVALTAQPPPLTRMLIGVSSALAQPVVWMVGLLALALIFAATRSRRGRKLMMELEPELCRVPAIGGLWQNVVGTRFLRVFSMAYKSGLPVLQGLELASASTGSTYVERLLPYMKETLMEGGTITECFKIGDFLPQVAVEAISSGETVGQVPLLLETAASMLEQEVETKLEAVSRLIEPIVLVTLGGIVGTFVLGCLLPIVELTEKL